MYHKLSQSNHIIMNKGIDTREYLCNKLLVFDRDIWNPHSWVQFVLDSNTWYWRTVCKQMVIINVLYISMSFSIDVMLD